MRIDAHQHFWVYSPKTHDWIVDSMAALRRDFLPEHLEPLLAAASFDGSIAVQATQTEAETTWLLELAHRHPFVLGVVGWVDLLAEDVGHRLARAAAHPKLRGIRHVVQSEPDDRFLLRGDFQRGLAVLARFGLVYDLLIYPRQLPAAIEVARRFPAQPFVLDHLAKPEIRAGKLEPWATLLHELARCPNVHCKLSGLVTEAEWKGWKPTDLAPYLDVALEAFGPRRVMIGSDWPVCTLAADHGQAIELVLHHLRWLSPEDHRDVLGGNASRVYLEAPRSPDAAVGVRREKLH